MIRPSLERLRHRHVAGDHRGAMGPRAIGVAIDLQATPRHKVLLQSGVGLKKPAAENRVLARLDALPGAAVFRQDGTISERGETEHIRSPNVPAPCRAGWYNPCTSHRARFPWGK